MKKYTFFVGADNQTGVCDLATLATIVSKYCNGFTLHEATGFCPMPERSAIVTVFAHNMDVKPLCEAIKRELKQNSVLVEISTPKLVEFI